METQTRTQQLRVRRHVAQAWRSAATAAADDLRLWREWWIATIILIVVAAAVVVLLAFGTLPALS
jgi:hypothetical protein